MPSRKQGRQPGAIALRDVELAAGFRSALRRFLHHTEAVAARAGITAQRYDLMLMVKSSPDQHATITELGASLDLRQQAVTELVKRAEEAGLVQRERSDEDRRVVFISLTRNGERALARVFADLEDDRAALVAAFGELKSTFGQPERRRTVEKRRART